LEQRRPLGTQIGAVVEAGSEPLFEPLKETLAAIDRVHGDGILPRLPARLTTGRTEIGGYRFSSRDGTPLRLELSQYSDHPHLTAAHEVGHFLDHQALGERGRYASESGYLDDLLDPINRSAAIKALRARIGRRHARVRMPDGSLRQHQVLPRYVNYLLRPSEVFARAYAQYVVVRSQNAVMTQQVNGVRRALLSGRVYHSQWDDDDFAAIGEAFDRLLRRKGWMA
jgi:hypothetical protein